MAIKRNHDGNQAQSDGAIRWRSDLARSRSLAPFEISHDLRRHRVVRVGEHPKQIGLAQPLARDTHGDAPDELGLESMAHLRGEGSGAVVSTCMQAETRTGMRPMNSGAPAI